MIISKDSFLYKVNQGSYRDLSDKEMSAFLKGSIVDLWKSGHLISGPAFTDLRKAILSNHY